MARLNSLHSDHAKSGGMIFLGEYMDVRPLVVTARGHRYNPMLRCCYSNDYVCVDCGAEGHFDYILDCEPCEPSDPEIIATRTYDARRKVSLWLGPLVKIAEASERLERTLANIHV